MESTALQPSIVESAEPDPPRYRWLKRSAVIAPVVLLLLVGLWFWWAAIAHRRLEAEIAAVHARGEPILLEDFKQEQIPDSENAAVYYSKAMAALLQGGQIENSWPGWDGPISQSSFAAFASLVDGETAAMALQHQARAYPKAVWPVVYRRPVLQTLLPRLGPQRQLCTVTCSAAFIAHQRGQDELAVEFIRDMHHQADSLQQYAPILLTSIVADGLDAQCSVVTIDLARDMQIDSAPPACARRQQVIDLIDELSDETAMKNGITHCLWGEQLFIVDPSTRSTLNIPRLAELLLGPAMDLDAFRVVRYETGLAAAWREASFPAANAKSPPGPLDNNTSADLIVHFLSRYEEVSFNRIAFMYFRALSQRRAAVIALALRLYRLDHAGAWPGSLNELSPQYLPALPLDPFSPAGSTFRYRPPSGATPPSLYSVGENGVDDGGILVPNASLYQRTRDLIYDIVAPPPPATEPSDSPDSPQTNGDQGNK